jgi:hypothetical protein
MEIVGLFWVDVIFCFQERPGGCKHVAYISPVCSCLDEDNSQQNREGKEDSLTPHHFVLLRLLQL